MNLEKGVTAYVNGEKITGALDKVTKYSVGGNMVNVTKDNTEIIVSSIEPTKGIFDNITITHNVNQNKIAEAIELTPEQIVSGYEVLGIQGTASTGGSDIIVEESYENLMWMVATEGDIALIMSKAKYAEFGTPFRVVNFPETITLPTGLGEEEAYEIQFTSDEAQITRSFNSFDQFFFSLNMSWNIGDERHDLYLDYESEDGITYRNVSDIHGEYDFGCNLYLNEAYCPEVAKYFFQIGEEKFGGVYKCHANNQWVRIDAEPQLIEANARIAELEAEIAEANTIIDQLNGEEV
jgi:hypothetical protein